MMRSKFLSLLIRAPSVCRSMSTATKLTTIDVNDKTGIATLTLNRSPINALNVELLQDLNESIKEIEDNKSRGLILTSVKTCLNSVIYQFYVNLCLICSQTIRYFQPAWT